MTDFDSVVLGPDDFLVLRPREALTPESAYRFAEQIPEKLRGRVLIVDPTAFDVVHVHPLRDVS